MGCPVAGCDGHATRRQQAVSTGFFCRWGLRRSAYLTRQMRMPPSTNRMANFQSSFRFSARRRPPFPARLPPPYAAPRARTAEGRLSAASMSAHGCFCGGRGIGTPFSILYTARPGHGVPPRDYSGAGGPYIRSGTDVCVCVSRFVAILPSSKCRKVYRLHHRHFDPEKHALQAFDPETAVRFEGRPPSLSEVRVGTVMVHDRLIEKKQIEPVHPGVAEVHVVGESHPGAARSARQRAQ